MFQRHSFARAGISMKPPLDKKGKSKKQLSRSQNIDVPAQPPFRASELSYNRVSEYSLPKNYVGIHYDYFY